MLVNLFLFCAMHDPAKFSFRAAGPVPWLAARNENLTGCPNAQERKM